MIEFNNLPEINENHSHATGNQLLKDFSSILSSAALSLCFVGRNGGNKFLAIFEDCSRSDMDTFEKRIEERVAEHNNKNLAIPINYRIGSAFNGEEKLNEITKLIALSDRRIRSADKNTSI